MSVTININVANPTENEATHASQLPPPKLLCNSAAADPMDFVPDELLELFGELGIGEGVVRKVLAESADIVQGLIEKAIQ